ncbi:putative calpain-like cysteine peptidase putativecysteine peptidase Clan CA family C2 [Leptomonas pyrrhocoris]|uniref:Putative calpain-like cysteine peptidase putativecysteine peptidase Clan CA family C2 n=1 Tax=Leptomonas pyrrhocoris TaxID=157538 RepID=A0A0N0DR42_LEPPY|nr:putative calpain-like cysteine peptidase putativecysteine peptidase Clan CA family C2 [Leptomonas pyrrhocoris]XP_015652380.1 putative calpain-like cysteine peptidase putativecysteine peptidase Clan CA family C2 [Leptomonas pyrrhocoris]KPA73940.1 putative calpain-like cysteine peptidase putativecysteine peptidase Clan CA family C2 [Leptomonas pyrrhocoris]KPA73941.1 putative calpain-like cysteine peptidase putativecysteine peptidase Clan CA family C2 [Leptomonas pyrrhocoris]|eukprot:XP_015652379.1 putative calpain-like cysteine peptidase putativecysteine peptidase Clan CA family C2 [Leptomonas pyrrhocoris]
MGKKADRNQKKVTKFKYGGPAVKGDSYALFDDGRCFRVEVGKKKWFLYNDTLEMEMHINFTFERGTAVHNVKHGRTEMKRTGAGSTQCTVIVYPLETIPFVKLDKKEGIAYSAVNSSRGLAPGYIEKVNREARQKCAGETRKVAVVAGVTHSDEELLYKCRKSRIPYVDMTFPPAEASLQRPSDTKKVANLEAVTWRRPQDCIPEMAHKEIKLFRAGVDPNDIGQGMLGDCWFMCSIAVVADSTTMIKDLFRHPVSKSKRKKEQKAGGYRVYINKNGWYHNVIVDSYLPSYNCAVYFGRSAGDPYELWVSLLEKAYAKVHGSFASIIGGNPLHALKDLTGFPVYSFNDTWKEAAFDEDKASAFFKVLLRHRQRGYLISISTPGTDTSAYNAAGAKANSEDLESRYTAAGLRTGHAYSVLKVRQFLMPRVKLLKIRNPWGTGDEWTGAWGKNSDKWKKHSLVRRSCKPSKESDGTFWMEWKDAVLYFEGGGVCMVKKKWFQYNFQGKFIGILPSIALKIELKKKQKIFFTLSQKDRRMLKDGDPEQLYKGLLISVTGFNAVTDMQQVISLSTQNPEINPPEKYEYTVARDVGLEIELDPARSPFYVIPRIMVANKGGPKDYTFGMLTPNKSSEKGLRVSFVHLPDSCPAFQQVSSFKMEGEELLPTRFQYKKRGGAPRLKEGVTAFGATNVKEEFPFPF